VNRSSQRHSLRCGLPRRSTLDRASHAGEKFSLKTYRSRKPWPLKLFGSFGLVLAFGRFRTLPSLGKPHVHALVDEVRRPRGGPRRTPGQRYGVNPPNPWIPKLCRELQSNVGCRILGELSVGSVGRLFPVSSPVCENETVEHSVGQIDRVAPLVS
jgi:hypothetical protein